MNQEKIGKFIAECRKNKNMTQQYHWQLGKWEKYARFITI